MNALNVKDPVTLLLSVPNVSWDDDFEERKGKTLNVSWDDDFEEEDSEPDSHTNEFENFIAFMAISNASSLQGSSDKDSKLGEDLDLHDFFLQ